MSWFSTQLIIPFSSLDLTNVIRRPRETLSKGLLKSGTSPALPICAHPVISLQGDLNQAGQA